MTTQVKKHSRQGIALLLVGAILILELVIIFALLGGEEKDGISRADWIHTLVDTYGYPDELSLSEPSFDDIDGTKYEEEIEIALAYGLILPGSSFYPDEPATREFAATTALRSMGYQPTGSIVCDDLFLIRDPAVANYAVALGLLSLEQNCFLPTRALSDDEEEQILSVIEQTEGSLTLEGEEALDGYVYQEGVVVLQDTACRYENGYLVLPLTDVTASLRGGELLAVNDSEFVSVDAVRESGEEVLISYSIPEIHEVLSRLDIEGTLSPDSLTFAPAEGVTVIYPEEEVAQAQRLHTMGLLDGIFDVPDSTLYGLPSFILKGGFDLPNGDETLRVEYDVKCTPGVINYKFDVDFNSIFSGQPPVVVKNAYMTLPYFNLEQTTKLFFLGGEPDPDDLLSYLRGIKEDERKYLGELSLVGGFGVGVNIDFYFVMTAEGSFNIVTTTSGIIGAQVLNNCPRNLTTLNTVSSAELTLELKAGLDIEVGVEVANEDLLNFTVKPGAGVRVSLKERNSGMLCADATIFAYLDISLLEESLIDKWLECAVEYNVWDHNNSPLKLKLHLEDFARVDKCTFEGEATITGLVAEADSRSTPISGAAIRIYQADGKYVTTVFAKSDGNYKVTLKTGSYRVEISADGYISFETNLSLSDEETVYMETLLMVAGDENETGTVGGTISNSVTGETIANARLTFRQGWNAARGESVMSATTDENGWYTVDLPLGNYTVTVEREDYLTGSFNIAVTRTPNTAWNSVMTPTDAASTPTGELRIVLSWGAFPEDLDSHLVGPTVNGDGRFHIYYSSKIYDDNGETQSFLDVDDTTSYGPETVTVYRMASSGTYSYYVHDYTHRSSYRSTDLAGSGAKVLVYRGDRLVATYYVPASGVGNTWHVFDYDARTGQLRPVNSFTDVENESTIG